MLKVHRLTDADGVPRTCVSKLTSIEHAAVFQAVRSRLPQHRFATGRRRAVAVAANLTSIVALMLLFMTVGRGRGYVSTFIILTIAGAMIAFVYDLPWHRRTIYTTASSEELRDAWLAEGHCPACAYPLSDAGDRPNHLYCPECGATWHVPLTAISTS